MTRLQVSNIIMNDSRQFVVYLKGCIQGPLDVEEVWQLEGFTLDTSVCPVGDDTWKSAREFTLITQRQNPGEEVAPSAHVTNWREAVINSDVPDFPSTRRYAPLVVQSGDPVRLTGVSHRASKAKPGSEWPRILYRQRKTFLLGGLVMIFTGLYAPQADMVAAICQGLATSDATLPSASLSRRWAVSRPPRRGPWKKPARTSSQPIPKPAAPPATIVEIGSEDLGNGMVQKTVVITRIVGGSEIHETKTIVERAKPIRKPRKKLSYLNAEDDPLS